MSFPPSGETVVAQELCPSCRVPVEESWLTCAHCGGPLAVAAELPVGTTLHEGRYRIDRVLGRGGFGITYAARDVRLQRSVAIKELFPESVVRHGSMALAAPEARAAFREAKTRFLREARVLARFSHPGIVRAYEVFEEHNTAYLVMELIEGRTLSQLLRERNPLPEDEVLSIAARVAPALEEVHAEGVLHRDINPSNIVVTPSGRVVLIDFGIARRYDSVTTGPLTRMVTPGYAPPEQYAQESGLGPPADVYAFAATLYRLFTGSIPVAAVDRQQGRPLPSPRALRAGLSKSTSDAVLDGLELDPRHRPQSMRAFVNRLGAEMEAPPEPETPPGGARGGVTTAAGAWSGATAFSSGEPPPPPVLVPQPAPPVLPGPPPSVFHAPERAIDGAYFGRPRAGRWKLTVPVGVALAALASASIVPVMAVIVLALGPALATWGDLVMHERRQHAGEASKRWHRLAPSTVAPVRVLRNLGAGLVWAVPGLAATAVTVVAGVLTGRWNVAHDVLVRLGGVAAAVLVLLPLARGGTTFRSGLGIDRALERYVDGRGRLLQAGWILWVVAVGATAFGLWLSPEVWPFRG